MQEEIIKRHSWVAIARGIITILFGGLVLLWPELTLTLLVLLFGLYAAFDGILALLVSVYAATKHDRWWVFLVEGIFGLTAGAVALLLPDFTVLALLYLVAAWAILTGLVEIWVAFSVPFAKSSKGILTIAGLFSMALGALMYLYPVISMVVIMWFVGVYALVFGLILVIFGIMVKKIEKTDIEEEKIIEVEEESDGMEDIKEENEEDSKEEK
ncbi:DUF308 domain-containing protein [Patescibacteria group bacterium]|nr:DUF308 domain-containing protein [Patescibacteria group bacterium]